MSLTAFLAENAEKTENVAFIVSERFRDAEGNPVPWEIRAISSAEDEAIRKSCTRRVQVPGKNRQFQQELDANMYTGRLAAACTVFPNLKSRELQESYRVMGEDALLKAMLTAGEFARYADKVADVCGFDAGMREDVEEAKN